MNTQRSPFVNHTVHVKRLRPDVEIPEYQTEGAAGFDLAIADDLHLASGQTKLAGTGLVFATPRNHMLYITFRSSTPRKWAVTVLEGILDEDYCGDEDECKLQVMNLDVGTRFVPRGTRIAQGVIIPIAKAQFVEVKTMGKSRGGFGSTGTGPRRVKHEF